MRQLGHSDVDVRVYGAEKLGESGNLEAVPHLISALQDEKVRVRLTAIDALGALGDERAAPALIPFLRDRRALLIFAAIDAMGQIGDASVVDSLVSFVEEGAPTFRLAAIDALGRIGDAAAVDALCSQTWDETPQVRWISAIALGRIGSPDAIAYLIELLGDESNQVREGALFSLAQIADNWRQYNEAELAIWRFLRDLKQEDIHSDKNALIRFCALQGLNSVAPNWRERDWAEGLVVHWCDWLANGNDNEREVAARVLGDLADKRAVDALLFAMNDADHGVRRQAIRSLGCLGDTRVTDVLKQVVLGDDTYVRGPAAWALGHLRDTSAVTMLAGLVNRDMLRSRGGKVGGDLTPAIARALGVLKDPRGVDALILMMKHRDGYVSITAARSLGQIGDSRAIEPLILALDSGSSGVRQSVAKAMSRFKDPRLETALVRRLGKKRWDDPVMVQALDSLDVNWRNRPDAQLKIDVMIRSFNEAKGRKRADEAAKLAVVRGDRVREVLIRALRQRDLQVVGAAHTFYIREHVRQAVPVLLQVLDSYGNAKMANEFLNSRYAKLAKAARRWVYAHGMALVHPQGESEDREGG